MLFPRGCSRNIRNSSPFPGHAGRFVECKCNIECCCYGWSFNNKVKGMTEDAARQASDGNYEHFRHLHDNPTYIQPRDWPVDSRRIGWNGKWHRYRRWSAGFRARHLPHRRRGIAIQRLEVSRWTGQRDCPNRWHGRHLLSDVFRDLLLGNIDGGKFNHGQLQEMKQSCQQHCFSRLNHNLAYCYDDARVLRWLWQQARRGFRGGARSFED